MHTIRQTSGLSGFTKLKRFFLFANKTYDFDTVRKLQHHRYTSSQNSFFSSFIGRDPAALAMALSYSHGSRSLVLGIQIHCCIVKLGYTNDIFTQNNLIKMYSACGVLSDGLKVFVEMDKRNIVSWTLLISGAIQCGEPELGFKIFLDMTRTGIVPNEFGLGSVMKACANTEATEFGLSIHCFALKIGMDHIPHVSSSILSFYAKLGDIEEAECMFRCMDNIDVGCYNAMVGGYAQCGYGFEAMCIVYLMRCRAIAMDKYTFISALQGCCLVGDLNYGKQIHGLIIRSEMEFSTLVMNALMDMYFKNRQMNSALQVFKRNKNRDVITWNTLLGNFSQYENPREVVSLFRDFMLTGMTPNHITFSVLFRQCGELRNLDLGLQLYCLALHFGCIAEANVTSALINMFSWCGTLEMARLVFDCSVFKNLIIWNELISGYNLNNCGPEALKTFYNLSQLGVEADEFTIANVLEACCRSDNQQMSRQIHGAVIKSGFASHTHVHSSLIKGYVKFGFLKDSCKFFNESKKLDMASWGAMISTLVHQGYNHEAITFFRSLIQNGKKPDEFILGSILNGCASVAAYDQTKSVHPFVIKLGFDEHVFVASAVIDTYSKCGDIESARIAFYQSLKSNDVIIYNTMIMAYAHHGLLVEALGIFEKIKLANLRPSQATFVSAISACGHIGLVDQGCLLFESMGLIYGMEPSPDVHGCLVDMLSRNGYLKDAKHVIEMMPFSPWPAILRSLLSGCRIYGNRELGEWAGKKLLQLAPENHASYLLLFKVYSESGSWDDAAKVSRGMMEKNFKNDAGHSWIEAY